MANDSKKQAVIKRVVSLVEKAQLILIEAIKERALQIVKKHPHVFEYVQAMGSASITVKIDHKEYTIGVRKSERDFELKRLVEDLEESESPSYRLESEILSIERDLEEIDSFINTWDDYFTGSSSGESFRVGKDGRPITDW
jgi:hypothetical protein